VAWLGAFVLLGLLLVALDVLRERLRNRKEQRMAELGVDKLPWSRRRQQLTAAGVIVGLAVVLGFVLWARSGGDTSSATEKLNELPEETSSSAAPSRTVSSSTTTTTLAPGRPPQQVRVSVVNSSGVTGAAAQKSGALGALGYQMVGLDNGASRAGTAVQCKPGFEREAAALARNVGQATVEALPSPPPTASSNPDCVVVLGA
jgi:hypothetical protein